MIFLLMLLFGKFEKKNVNYQGSSIASIDRVSVAKSSVRQDDTLPVRLVAAIGNVKYGVEFDSKSETYFRP